MGVPSMPNVHVSDNIHWSQQAPRLQFYTVYIDRNDVKIVAAEDPESAKILVKKTLRWWKRFFVKLKVHVDSDPVELTDSGYRQKLANCDIVQELYSHTIEAR